MPRFFSLLVWCFAFFGLLFLGLLTLRPRRYQRIFPRSPARRSTDSGAKSCGGTTSGTFATRTERNMYGLPVLYLESPDGIQRLPILPPVPEAWRSSLAHGIRDVGTLTRSIQSYLYG